jgi:hypothetical protein
MRFWCILLFWLGTVTLSAAQSDDFAARVQNSYRKAKTRAEMNSVTMWCKDIIVSMNFKEHDRVMVLAVKAMEANKIEEANTFLKQAKALDELSENLGAIVCKKK